MSYYTPNNNSGFTLIEIISVLLLLGILTASAVNHADDFMSGNNVILEADTLKNNLRYIQMRAMNSSDSDLWCIRVHDDNYTITDSNGTLRGIYGDEKAATGTHELQANIQASTTTPTICFDYWGIPVGSNSTKINTDITINFSQGSNTKDVTITKNTGYTYL